METKPEKEAWKPFSPDVYRDVARTLVHFSTKGVNSNAEAGGIRLGRESGLNLPYVSARCLLERGVELAVDCTKNAGNTATVVKQIRKLATDEHGESVDAAKAIRAAIVNAVANGDEFGTETVSPRLRQLLLPRENGEYVAVTPLPAGGLSEVINERIQAHHTAIDEAHKQAKDDGSTIAHIPHRLRIGTLGVGGANPQNVGALVREMQTLLVFDAPTENPELRDAYRIHYQGIPIRLPFQGMKAWRTRIDRAMAANGGKLPTDLNARVVEQDLLLNVVKTVLRSGAKALALLENHQEQLPGGALLSSELQDPVIRGLIVPAERGNDWARAFGERVAKEIGSYSPDKQGVLVALNSEALTTMARWFEEEAR